MSLAEIVEKYSIGRMLTFLYVLHSIRTSTLFGCIDVP